MAKKFSNPTTLEFFKHFDREQLDAPFFTYVTEVMKTDEVEVAGNSRVATFKMFGKSVCFKNRVEKRKYNGVRPVGYPDGAPITKTCVCVESFHQLSKKSSSLEPHVALVEGKIGRIDPAKLHKNVLVDPDSSGETEHQFHCCMVIVDNKQKTVHIFNPWKQGQARSGIVKRVCDIRPRLVKELVAKYKGYTKFHLSGDQVWTSDCRIRVAQFAKKLGAKGRTGYKSGFNWVKI